MYPQNFYLHDLAKNMGFLLVLFLVFFFKVLKCHTKLEAYFCAHRHW